MRDFLRPKSALGAVVYAVLFIFLGVLGTRLPSLFLKRSTIHVHDQMAVNFMIQLLQVSIFIAAIILYAQLVPSLRSLGTALLAGVSVVSVVLGLAAQSTLGNLVAGVALLLYR